MDVSLAGDTLGTPAEEPAKSLLLCQGSSRESKCGFFLQKHGKNRKLECKGDR